MKQEKVILDYGRKNRLNKLVSGGQGLAQASQNLGRKGTHQLSMSMNQFLNQGGQHQQHKHRASSTQYPNQMKQKSMEVEQRQSSKSRSPEMGGAAHQAVKMAGDGSSYNANQMGSSTGMAGAKTNQAMHRQSSANSDSRQQQAKQSGSHQASQMQTASFGASNPLQASSGPPSSSVHNQHPRKMSGAMQAQTIEQDAKRVPATNMAHQRNQYLNERDFRQGLKIQERNSGDLLSRAKPDGQPTREHYPRTDN